MVMFFFCRVFLRRRSAGIIGLPNVGKSTFFNALTCSTLAKTGNFPFCTINANFAKVPVVDERLRKLAVFSGANKIIDVEIDLADVAGLIEGASKGAGLGNKFLNDIRPCTILLHMVRCFESVKDGFDRPTPLEDIATIINELVLADLEVMEKLLHKNKETRKKGDSAVAFCQRVVSWLQEGKPISDMKLKNEEEWNLLQQYQLFTAKPMVFVLNMDEASVVKGNEFSTMVKNKFGVERVLCVSACIEEQTSHLPSREERLMFLAEYGINVPQSEMILRHAYRLLRLQSFFTVGPLMAHGWSIKEGATVKEASGEIHSDMERHFLRAKVLPYNEFITRQNFEAAERQMIYVDAKYIMKDGDVIIVEHSALR